MLSQENIETIADVLKVDAEKLATAINSQEEVKVELPELVVFKNDDFETLKTNIKKEGYNEGKTAGSEMTAKEFKKIAKLEIEGKDLTAIYDALKSQLQKDAKTEPNEKIKEQEAVIKKLQETIATKDTELSNAQNQFDSFKLESSLLAEIPHNTVGLSNKTILQDMKANGYDVKIEDGKRVVTKNGEVLRNNLQNPLSFVDVANSYLTEKNWLKTERQGRGVGDDFGGNSSYASIKNMQDFEKYCQENKVNPHSDEAKAVLIEARKSNNF